MRFLRDADRRGCLVVASIQEQRARTIRYEREYTVQCRTSRSAVAMHLGSGLRYLPDLHPFVHRVRALCFLSARCPSVVKRAMSWYPFISTSGGCTIRIFLSARLSVHTLWSMPVGALLVFSRRSVRINPSRAWAQTLENAAQGLPCFSALLQDQPTETKLVPLSRIRCPFVKMIEQRQPKTCMDTEARRHRPWPRWKSSMWIWLWTSPATAVVRSMFQLCDERRKACLPPAPNPE